MKKSVVFLMAALGSFNAMAQTVQEGVGNLYAERFQSARSVFEKLTAANPNNLEAVYWLGQTHLAQGDTAGAKALYQRTLATNGNAPWILAGMGQLNLLEGKAAEARAQFEQAITLSKGKKANDPAVLNAVGRANVQSYTDSKPYGDLDYAIAKLNEAGQLAPTNPDIFVNLGNAYRKKNKSSGGEAVQAYRKAGNYAPALYRTASIYKSQQNWDAVQENLNSALAADAKFAPAYEELYYYNLNTKRDIRTAESYGKLYVSNSDASVENDYILAQNAFVAKRFQEAVDIGNKIVQQTNNNPKPRVYRLLAYSYLELKDTTKACDASNLFLGRATEDILQGTDYLLHARACARGNSTIILADIQKAVNMDSVPSRQIKLLNDAVIDARGRRDYALEANLMLTTQRLQAERARPADLFYIGTILYYANDYSKSDSVLSAYVTAFPDSLQGYYWRGLSRSRIDTTMAQGLAVSDFERTIQLGEVDKERFKSQAVQSAQVLAIYYNNVKSDKAAAQAIVAKGLEFDPTNTALLTLQAQLAGKPKAPATTPKTPAKTEAKPKTTANPPKAKPKK